MEVKIIKVELEVKEIQIEQSDAKGFRKHLSEGYHVVGREGGFTQLKRVRIIAIINQNERIRVINLKAALYAYYGVKRDYELVYNITQDLDKDCVGLKGDSKGCWKLFKK